MRTGGSASCWSSTLLRCLALLLLLQFAFAILMLVCLSDCLVRKPEALSVRDCVCSIANAFVFVLKWFWRHVVIQLQSNPYASLALTSSAEGMLCIAPSSSHAKLAAFTAQPRAVSTNLAVLGCADSSNP